MRIPLPEMMRYWREREFERRLSPVAARSALGLWGFFAKRPAAYRFATDLTMRALRLVAGARGRFSCCRSPAAGPDTATCRRRRG